MASKNTVGRNKLSDEEPTVKAGICLPESLMLKLKQEGKKSGNGYGHHIRLACEKMYGNKRLKKDN